MSDKKKIKIDESKILDFEDAKKKYAILPPPPTEKQQKVFEEFREIVDKHLEENPQYKKLDHSDGALYRFLRARDYSLKKSQPLYFNYLKWRTEYAEIPIENPPTTLGDWGSYYILPKPDKFGRPVVVCRVCNHNPKKRNVDESLKEFIAMMEKICSELLKDGNERLNCIVEFKDSTSKNNDLTLVRKVSQILQDYFPERLGVAFLVFNSWTFSAFWSLIKIFLDPKTVQKVHFLGTSGFSEPLLSVIDMDNLPETFGGDYPVPEPKVNAWDKK